MSENNDKEYDGWREPKIAMSFHRNRLKYYGGRLGIDNNFYFLEKCLRKVNPYSRHKCSCHNQF